MADEDERARAAAWEEWDKANPVTAGDDEPGAFTAGWNSHANYARIRTAADENERTTCDYHDGTLDSPLCGRRIPCPEHGNRYARRTAQQSAPFDAEAAAEQIAHRLSAGPNIIRIIADVLRRIIEGGSRG